MIIIKISDEQYRLGAFVVSEDASGATKRIYYNFEVIFMGETYKVESLELFPSEPDAE